MARRHIAKQIGRLFVFLALSACATPSGNYTRISNNDYTFMASDTAHQLVQLYPPASTQFQIAQKDGDPYGKSLVSKLRAHGYAIKESSQLGAWIDTVFTQTSETQPPKKASSSAKNKGPHESAAHSLNYLLDKIDDDLYRVTVTIDNESLSRVYEIRGRHIFAVAAWARKEEQAKAQSKG